MSIGEELQQVPRAFGYSVAGLMDLEKGYTEVSFIMYSDGERLMGSISSLDPVMILVRKLS